jgi:lipopolysaccharide export system protein LptA
MSRHLVGCFLASISLVCWMDSRASAEIVAASNADTLSLTIGALDAQAEDIQLDVRRDGTRLLKLSGKVSLNIGNIRATGDKAEISFSAKSNTLLYLVGEVHVHTDAIRASADRAKIDVTSAIMELNSGDGQPVTLHAKVAESESRIEASAIRINGQKDSIEASGTATIKQEP